MENELYTKCSFAFKPLTKDALGQTLIQIGTANIQKSEQPVYINPMTFEVYWDILYDDKSIIIYGIKLINKIEGLFIYEGVLFDKFPKDFQTLYVSYIDERSCDRCEEIEIVELTDTKIIFKSSFILPDNINNFKIHWL